MIQVYGERVLSQNRMKKRVSDQKKQKDIKGVVKNAQES